MTPRSKRFEGRSSGSTRPGRGRISPGSPGRGSDDVLLATWPRAKRLGAPHGLLLRLVRHLREPAVVLDDDPDSVLRVRAPVEKVAVALVDGPVLQELSEKRLDRVLGIAACPDDRVVLDLSRLH